MSRRDSWRQASGNRDKSTPTSAWCWRLSVRAGWPYDPEPRHDLQESHHRGLASGRAGPPGPRADIRAFDARRGRFVWAFHTVPQPGEPNHESWTGEEWRDVTGANVWSTMSVDEANGIVYAPLGDINGRFQGPELYSTSLLALDAATGKLKWHRQLVHKDMWDWDLAGASNPAGGGA